MNPTDTHQADVPILKPGPTVDYIHECACGTSALVQRTDDPYTDTWKCPRCPGEGTISHSQEFGARHEEVKARSHGEKGRE
jgi:hypothetical protein